MKMLPVVLLCASLLAGAPVKRPKILGLAHVALHIRDVAKAHAFYSGILGFQEPYHLDNPDGRVWISFVKINDSQFLELFPDAEPESDRLSHYSVETGDIQGMRAYLVSRGYEVPPVGKGRIGNLNFTVKDPDGHALEFVQYLPGSRSSADSGQHLGTARISPRMTHVGILVGALEPALNFYRDVLGFEETWRGSRDGKQLNWVNMRVPDGQDYVEFMLYDRLPAPAQRGTVHHVCLETADLQKTVELLKARPGYAGPLEIRTGVNRRRQLNLYDPDGTRVELMETRTVDGKPAPSSAAPAPR